MSDKQTPLEELIEILYKVEDGTSKDLTTVINTIECDFLDKEKEYIKQAVIEAYKRGYYSLRVHLVAEKAKQYYTENYENE